MNKIDIYWVWCTKAIANPNISNDKYYYDASLDRLFGLRYDGNDIIPLFRNPWWTEIVEKRQLFQEEIFNLKKDNSSVLELPRLSFEIKKDFLSKFISNIDNEFSALKMALLEELSSFTQQSEYLVEIKNTFLKKNNQNKIK